MLLRIFRMIRSKIPCLFALLHRCFRHAVVHACGAAFGNGGSCGFGDDVFGRGGGAGYGAGAGNIADGTEAHVADLGNFTSAFRRQRGNGDEQPVAFDDFARVAVINRR